MIGPSLGGDTGYGLEDVSGEEPWASLRSRSAVSEIRDFLAGQGLPRGDLNELPDSAKRFPDGAQYRVEIPSTEGPRCLEAVLEEAERLDVRVHRVSQGSGVFMQTDAELDEMAWQAVERTRRGEAVRAPERGVGLSATARAHAGFAAGAHGQEQVVANLEDCVRAAAHGFRSVLIADLGVLALFGEARARACCRRTCRRRSRSCCPRRTRRRHACSSASARRRSTCRPT